MLLRFYTWLFHKEDCQERIEACKAAFGLAHQRLATAVTSLNQKLTQTEEPE